MFKSPKYASKCFGLIEIYRKEQFSVEEVLSHEMSLPITNLVFKLFILFFVSFISSITIIIIVSFLVIAWILFRPFSRKEIEKYNDKDNWSNMGF